MGTKEEVESLISDWKSERPDLEMGSVRVFLSLRRAMQNAEARRAALIAKYDLTPPSLDLLVALRRSGPPYERTPSELARLLVLTTGGVSQRLARMEEAGLVRRRINTDDRRVIHVRLTDRGLKTLDALMEEYMSQEEELLHGLSPTQRAQLAKLLEKLDASILSAKLQE